MLSKRLNKFSFEPREKFNNFNKYRYKINTIEELSNDYKHLFDIYTFFNKENYIDNKINKRKLKNIVYYYYSTIVEKSNKEKLSKS
jgi:hypothetical protein